MLIRVRVYTRALPNPALSSRSPPLVSTEEVPECVTPLGPSPLRNLHFLWVLDECVCVKQIPNSLRKDTPQCEEVTRGGTDVSRTILSS